MMPIYMDSYPHLRSQVPSGQCYYPCYDGIPPQMTVDQARYPMMYGPCSNGSNPGHMIPCYACCYHVNVPVYCSFNPLASHLTSSPFLHSCGHHPVFTAPSHVNYQFTPHHSAVQRRYEYDKEAQRDYHCSGCPNHICNQKSGGVNIEEQDPEIVRKNDSLVPINTKNYPYPVMWIPPEYIKKIYEKGRPLESEVGDQKNAPRNTESHEDTKSPEKGTRVWNGWFPLDLNSLKPLMHEEDKERIDNCLTEDKLRQFPHPIIWMPSNDGKEDAQKDQKKMNGWFPIDISGLKSLMKDEVEKGKQNQQVEDKRRQFPYPIIWIPSHSEQGQADKEDQRDSNVALKAEEPLSSFKVIPVETSEIEDDSLNKSENRNNVGNQAKSTQTMDNIANQRLNSAKRVEVQKKEDSCNETRKVSDDTSKYSETVATDSPTRAILSKQLSPQKTSKLPPVCLRVEPLLKKKNGSCSSRSPSPPGSNKGSLEKAKEPSLSSASSSLKENTQQEIQTQDCFMNKSEKVEPAEMERKVVHLADDRNCENKNEDWRTGSQRKKPMRLHIDSEEDTFNKSSTKGTERDTDKFEDDERVRDGRDMVGEMATKNKICHSAEVADGEGVRKIKNLSDMEAAKLIQSAYRGFEVRKMEPLKKLKQMAEVRKQVAEIRNNILALESTADLQKNDRERDAIGEMIMRLLLKLDTVQGLHSSLRDVRKALVRELVTLQEKLDSLVTKNREATKLAVDPKIGTDSVVGMQEMQNKEAGIIENSVETSGDSSSNTKEQDQSQLSQSAPTECQDTSEPSLTDKKLLGSCENEIRELFVASDMDPPVVVLTSNLQLEEKAVNGAHDGIEVDKTQLEEKNGVHPELEQSLQFPLVTEEKTISEEIVEAPAMDLCYKPNGLEDRAKVAIHVDDILQASNSRLEEVEQTGKGENKIEDHEMESSMLSDPNLSTDIDKMMATKVEVDKKTVATKESEINMLAELPLGAIEDEPAVSASEELETNLLAELPLGAIEDEPAVFASEELETNLLAELPLGVIEDEPAVSAFGELKQIEARKDEASCHDKTIDNVITNTTALTEAEDLGKVMSEELPVNAAPEEEETQPLSSVAIVGQRDQEMMDVDHAPSLETAVTDVATEESELKREKVWEAEVNEKKEEDVLLDSQCEEAKCIIDRDKVEDKLPNELESSKENVVVATLIPQKSIDEEEIVMGRDKKLVEENAKLRAMMEKLMEAGKEQLTVISNLTGRVKDLERKLSRNQKERIRRSRKTLTKTTKGRGC